MRRKFVLDVGLSAVALSIDALVFVGHIALYLRGGRARFVHIPYCSRCAPTAADEAAAHPTHHFTVFVFVFS